MNKEKAEFIANAINSSEYIGKSVYNKNSSETITGASAIQNGEDWNVYIEFNTESELGETLPRRINLDLFLQEYHF